MGTSKAVKWIAGAVVVAVLVALGGWALVIMPRLSSADEMRAEIESQHSQRDVLQIQLAGLKHDFENMDALKEQLAALQTQIPADYNLGDITRQISDQALQAGVFVESIKPGMPTAATPLAPVAAPVAPTTGDSADSGEKSGTDDSSADSSAGGTATAAPTMDGLYAVEIEISVLGGFAPTVDFLNRLQTGLPRLLLVSGLTLTGQQAAPAAGGKPVINEGDAETVVKVLAYVLRDPNVVPDDGVPDDGETPSVLPAPGAGANPFGTTNS